MSIAVTGLCSAALNGFAFPSSAPIRPMLSAAKTVMYLGT
jgi:hypothetical protein